MQVNFKLEYRSELQVDELSGVYPGGEQKERKRLIFFVRLQTRCLLDAVKAIKTSIEVFINDERYSKNIFGLFSFSII